MSRRVLQQFAICLIVFLALSSFVSAQIYVPSEAGSVDILYQTSGYVPPLYPGKAIRADQNEIVLTAIASDKNGTVINPKNVLFTWSKDGEVHADLSGLGVNTFKYDGGGVSRPFTVNVRASTRDAKVNASNEINIDRTSPEIILYENNPLYGFQFQKALTQSVILNGQEMKISAFPFFFSAAYGTKNSFTYSWSMNGTVMPGITTSDLLLRKTDTDSGTATINVDVQNTKQFLQSARAGLMLKF